MPYVLTPPMTRPATAPAPVVYRAVGDEKIPAGAALMIFVAAAVVILPPVIMLYLAARHVYKNAKN